MSQFRRGIFGALLLAGLAGCAMGVAQPARIETRVAAGSDSPPPVALAPALPQAGAVRSTAPQVNALPDIQSPASMAIALPTPLSGASATPPPAPPDGGQSAVVAPPR